MLTQIQQYSQMLLQKESISIQDLSDFLNAIQFTEQDLDKLRQHKPNQPYGRKVLLNLPTLEVMLATWTRGIPCAPHDHGGAVSAIRVLQGRSHHRLYHIEDQQLKEQSSEKKSAGELITCEPHQIHSMADDGDSLPLLTLHAYSTSIASMVVYDDHGTILLKGSAGAWLPPNTPNDVLARYSQYHYRKELPLFS